MDLVGWEVFSLVYLEKSFLINVLTDWWHSRLEVCISRLERCRVRSEQWGWSPSPTAPRWRLPGQPRPPRPTPVCPLRPTVNTRRSQRRTWPSCWAAPTSPPTSGSSSSTPRCAAGVAPSSPSCGWSATSTSSYRPRTQNWRLRGGASQIVTLM